MDNIGYVKTELNTIWSWINQTLWLRGNVEKVERHNTGFHDAKITLKNGEKFIIEVKEDEDYWYSRTGNLGFDYISAFRFNSDKAKSYWVKKNDKGQWMGAWINPNKLDLFSNYIKVNKYGKLKTCDSHIQLYSVYEKDENNNKKIKLIKAYSNKRLTDKKFVKNLETTERLRVNNKSDYDSKTDTWDSAFYCLNPLTNQYLIDSEINSLEDLMNTKK